MNHQNLLRFYIALEATKVDGTTVKLLLACNEGSDPNASRNEDSRQVTRDGLNDYFHLENQDGPL